ncbi:MAG: RNA polymerase sigma factor [Flavobacteriales bacterium]|nr:RNA polymerase sigma factor [Flavobacteriales bacterium]
MNNKELYEIIEGCKQNDRQAQKLLFEMFSERMMGVCLRYSNSYESARDMAQEGFIKVFTKMKSFKGNSALETWMTRIFINTCLTNLNKKENKVYHLDINDPVVAVKTEAAIVEDEEVEETLRSLPVEKILHYISLLPDIYRQIINMYSIDGLSHQQIAEELDIQVGSSKSRLSRARVLLIELIKENEDLIG